MLGLGAHFSRSIGGDMKVRNLVRFGLNVWRQLRTVFLFCAATAIASSAQLTTLVDFKGPNGGNPSNLTQGFDGNLYGTTIFGGTHKLAGTVFKVTTAGKLTTLHDFCSVVHAGECDDGYGPLVGLTLATDGSLYGTNTDGGPFNANYGTIFAITEDGELTTLFDFPGYPNGWDPRGLVHAANGNFFGVTYYGGTNCASQLGCGTFYETTPEGAPTILYSFCSQAGCADGSNPYSTPIQAANGNFYGTTVSLGSGCCGTIYKITPSGILTTLHNFNGPDGVSAETLIQGIDGNFYGTTLLGGSSNFGTIFKITPKGVFTTLHNFCTQTNCPDGSGPTWLLQANDGNFYGVASDGGTNDGGTLFEMTPGGTLTTLYNFCSQPNCSDGIFPVGIVQYTDGNFYGTTVEGGVISGTGTVFRFTSGLGPFVGLVRESGAVGQISGILGQGLTGTTAVFLNGSPVSFSVVSDTYIQATVPAGATSGYVTVDTPSGTLTSNTVFHVIP